jgi:hypothetical protein
MQFDNIECENFVVMLNIDAHKIVFCHGHFRTVCAGHVSDDN